MILGVKGLTLLKSANGHQQKIGKPERKLGKVKGGGGGHVLEWHLISGGRGVAVLLVTTHY